MAGVPAVFFADSSAAETLEMARKNVAKRMDGFVFKFVSPFGFS